MFMQHIMMVMIYNYNYIILYYNYIFIFYYYKDATKTSPPRTHSGDNNGILLSLNQWILTLMLSLKN